MILVKPTQFTVANAILAGASTASEISVETGLDINWVKRVLVHLGDTLGIARFADGTCNRDRVIEAVRLEECFGLRGQDDVARNDHPHVDRIPVADPKVSWPDYSPHELRFRWR